MDEDDDPETNQAGRSVNEPNNSSQMPFSAPPEKEDPSAKRETEGRRETRKRNASEPIQSSAKVADEKKTPTSIATSAPKGAEGAPPEVNLMETSDWADTTEMAEELGRITVRASLDPALKGAGETVNPITWANVAEDLPYAIAIHGGQADRLPITIQEFEEVRNRLNAMLLESLKNGQPARTKVRWSKFKGGAGLIACIDESTQNWYVNATKSIAIDNKTFRAWRPNERGIHKHPAQFYLLENVGIHPTEAVNAIKVWNEWNGSFSLGPTRKFSPRSEASKPDCPDTCDEDDDNDENLQRLVKNEMKPGWRIRFYADDELRSAIEKNNRRAYLLDKEIVIRFLKNQPAMTNPAKRPTPGAAPAAKKSKTSNGPVVDRKLNRHRKVRKRLGEHRLSTKTPPNRINHL